MLKISNGFANVLASKNCRNFVVFANLIGGLSANAMMNETMALKRGTIFEM
jgi:hypothetical protein